MEGLVGKVKRDAKISEVACAENGKEYFWRLKVYSVERKETALKCIL